MLDVKRLVAAERAGIVRIDWPETATQDEVLVGVCEWQAPAVSSGFFAFQHSEQRG
jgi:hypothetical protein